MRHTPPDNKIELEHQIRRAHLWVTGSAWADDCGIYKTQLNEVTFDGTSVLELLTDDDLQELSDAIEPAIHADAADDSCSAFVPARDAHRLGE
jgi:hypothetical protein